MNPKIFGFSSLEKYFTLYEEFLSFIHNVIACN